MRFLPTLVLVLILLSGSFILDAKPINAPATAAAPAKQEKHIPASSSFSTRQTSSLLSENDSNSTETREIAPLGTIDQQMFKYTETSAVLAVDPADSPAAHSHALPLTDDQRETYWYAWWWRITGFIMIVVIGVLICWCCGVFDRRGRDPLGGTVVYTAGPQPTAQPQFY